MAQNAVRNLAVLVAMAFALPAGAQRGAERENIGRGYFQIGGMGLDLGALNSALRTASYPKLATRFLTLGGAGFGEHGRWLIGGEGQALIGSDETTTSGAYQVSLNGGYGLFKVGYKAVSRPDCDLTPMIGFGGGGMRLDIVGRSAPTFGAVLTDPGRSSRLTSAEFIMDLGITATHLFHNDAARNGRRGGLLLGGSAGYLFAPGSVKWRLDDINSVGGAPSLKVQGPYARFAIGGWGGRRRG
jgi:hypothetical protein